MQFGNASKANLKVVVRVRPQNAKELDCNARLVDLWLWGGESNVLFLELKKIKFFKFFAVQNGGKAFFVISNNA